MPTLGWLQEDTGGIAQDQPSVERAQELASQASQFLTKVSGTPALPMGDRLPLEKAEPLPAWGRGCVCARLTHHSPAAVNLGLSCWF